MSEEDQINMLDQELTNTVLYSSGVTTTGTVSIGNSTGRSTTMYLTPPISLIDPWTADWLKANKGEIKRELEYNFFDACTLIKE